MSENEEFIAFPLHNVVAAFEDEGSLDKVVDELKEKGFTDDAMRSFIGEKGMQKLDFDGSDHGPMAELLRALQHIGPDRTYLERYKKYMRDGDCILMVYAPQDERKQLAADIMRKHSIHRVTYFGTLVIEEL